MDDDRDLLIYADQPTFTPTLTETPTPTTTPSPTISPTPTLSLTPTITPIPTRVPDQGILLIKGPMDLSGYVVREISDGGLLLVGTRNETMWVMKLAPDFSVEWKYELGGSNDARLDALEIPDEGYILAGTSNGNLWVIRLNLNGDVIWHQSFGGWDEDRDVSLVLDNNGFLVAGAGLKEKEKVGILVSRFTLDGNHSWEKLYLVDDHSTIVRMEQTHQGSFMLWGHSGGKLSTLEINHQGEVIRQDAMGLEQDFSYKGNPVFPYIVSAQYIPRLDNFIIAGILESQGLGAHTQYDAWIARIDRVGNLVWLKKIFRNITIMDIYQTPNNILIAGKETYDQDKNAAWFASITDNGGWRWLHSIDTEHHVDVMRWITTSQDGSPIFIGDLTCGMKTCAAIIKTTRSGGIPGCQLLEIGNNTLSTLNGGFINIPYEIRLDEPNFPVDVPFSRPTSLVMNLEWLCTANANP
jgi:hypothetical protein